MRNDLDAIIDDLIGRWHRWCAAQGTDLGYPKVNTSCRLYRVSRQYDFDNGAMDDDVEAVLMGGVDQCVNRLVDPWRTAVHMNARNIAVGVCVWSSPRLPANRDERAVVVMEARVKLLRELQAAGLV